MDEKVAAETEVMLRNYVRRWGPTDEFTVIEAELHIEVPLGHSHILVMRPDGVIRWRDLNWVLENKTTQQLGPTYFDRFFLNQQTVSYVYGVSVFLKIPVVGVYVNVAKKSKTGNHEFAREAIRVTRDQMASMVDSFTNVTDDIQSRNPKELREWPQDTRRCHDYGKCPFWEVCAHGAPAEAGPLYTKRQPDYVEEK